MDTAIASLPRGPRRLGPRGQRVFDLAVVAVLLLVSLVTVGSWAVNVVGRTSQQSVFVEVLLSLTLILPLLFRRQRPVLVFSLIVAVSALQVLLTDSPLPAQLSFPLAVYAVARYRGRRLGWLALGVGLVASAVAAEDWVPPGTQSADHVAGFLTFAFLCAASVVTAWALGNAGFTREAYVAALIERGERLAEASAQQAVIAAADERVRIAREMHDVVAHGLSVMVVQADGARYAAGNDPDVAVSTLGRLADTGRESLSEMRRLLGLLRGDTDADYAPAPSIGDLATLVDQHRQAGLAVQADLPDPDVSVPGGTALTVYRVVQESLTNVRKHAGPTASTTVAVQVADDWIDVVVQDDGRGAAAADEHGFGLLGMRERVAVHDGDLDAGPRIGGGWQVHARIPL